MHKNDLESVCCIAQEASDAIMAMYNDGFSVDYKADKSPVTQADIIANDLILQRLADLTPDIPIISEEQETHFLPEGTKRFWLIDPIDGTKSFVRKTGEFTVNIALIEHQKPVLGVIVVPVQQQLYAGIAGEGAFRQIAGGAATPIHTRVPDAAGLDVIVSHSHPSEQMQKLLGDYTLRSRTQASSSLKFCRVAEGAADLYPRLGPTMQWDTAAGHAIVQAAGGRMVRLDGSPFTYAADDFRNEPFMVWGR